jgi:predicted XRE-type DNA-binding protein
MKRKTTVRQGSANLFADLKLPDADELHAKAQIAYQICGIVKDRKLTQKAAAQRLGIDPRKVSALLHGRLEGFSPDGLGGILKALSASQIA